MKCRLVQVADDFWNIRGSFKVGGVIDVGTHASLVRRANGKFLWLDAYTLSESVEREVRAITGGGADIEAILNLHPFHTVHVRGFHGTFPHARLYGTARHVERFPDLPWRSVQTTDPKLHAAFAEDLDFSVPRGVDFISKNDNVHFSSVLAYHRASRTIHVDDTLMYVKLPKVAARLGRSDVMSLHPTLALALQRRAGAATEFRRWGDELIGAWADAENLCAAHSASLLGATNRGESVQERILHALDRAERVLARHERKFG